MLMKTVDENKSPVSEVCNLDQVNKTQASQEELVPSLSVVDQSTVDIGYNWRASGSLQPCPSQQNTGELGGTGANVICGEPINGVSSLGSLRNVKFVNVLNSLRITSLLQLLHTPVLGVGV